MLKLDWLLFFRVIEQKHYVKFIEAGIGITNNENEVNSLVIRIIRCNANLLYNDIKTFYIALW